MNVNLPAKVRLTLYIVFGVGAFIVTYLLDTARIGIEEVKLFTGIGGFVYGLAAINTPAATTKY